MKPISIVRNYEMKMISTCCYAEVYENSDICKECKEHSEVIEDN